MKGKRSYLSQSDVPGYSLEKALIVGQALVDNYAGRPAKPIDVAIALNLKPTTGGFRLLTGASIAYGITNGGYNADVIELTELGKRILTPTEEGMEIMAKVEAVLKPRVLKEFYEKYNGNKIPNETIIKNVISQNMGVPVDKANDVLLMIKENASYVGILKDIKGTLFISMDTPNFDKVQSSEGESKPNHNNNIPKLNESHSKEQEEDDEIELPESLVEKLDIKRTTSTTSTHNLEQKIANPRVFITHGKNKAIVEQLKEILQFGKFEVVVSVEKETLAIPVPDKVLNDMRSCNAAVIHIASEQQLLDTEGKVHNKINENVLIEIGAAMALYDKNFVLLVQKGINLPSNLQGLYLCYYEGEKLDYDATIKLLKTFNSFKIQ